MKPEDTLGGVVSRPSAQSGDSPFATALNRLFDLHRKPDGAEYTLGEINRATGISASYLSLARKGGIRHPSPEKVAALASFFQVDASEVTGTAGGPSFPPGSPLAAALAHSDVERMALRAGNLDPEDRAFVFSAMEDALKRLDALKRWTEQRVATNMDSADTTPLSDTGGGDDREGDAR